MPSNLEQLLPRLCPVCADVVRAEIGREQMASAERAARARVARFEREQAKRERRVMRQLRQVVRSTKPKPAQPW